MQRFPRHALILLAVLVAIHASRSITPLVAGDKKGADVLDAVQFTKVYAESGADFDKKYKGKTLTVEGRVAGTSIKLAKATFLMIDGYTKPGQSYAHQIRCEESSPDFEGIRIGHKVQIRGTVQGHSETSVAAELRECKVVKVFGDDYPPSKATKAEVQKLQGNWKVVSAEANGKPLDPKQVFVALSFEGYTAYLHNSDKQLLQFGAAVNPEKKPKTLDLVGAIKTLPSIYTLEGDKLRVALPAVNKDGSFSRPADFDTTKVGSIVLNAERQK